VRKSKRQIIRRIVEGLAVGLVALNILTLYVVYRPLGDRVNAEARHYTELRQSVRNMESRVDRLGKFQEALPQSEKELQEFATNRVPSRRQAYSVAAHLVHRVADAAGVKLMSTVYRLDSDQHDPLERLSLGINAAGSYSGLVKFSHALETANDFLLVREFSLVPGDNGALSLRLDADLFITP
jgi:Tfp pilus assembly protein PilO